MFNSSRCPVCVKQSSHLLPLSSLGPGTDWWEGTLCCGHMVAGLAVAPRSARCRTVSGPDVAGASEGIVGPSRDGGVVPVAAAYKYCAF